MSIATISNYKDWPYTAQERQRPLPPRVITTSPTLLE